MTSRYILITAAKNEAEYIDRTIESVLTQTVRPVLWLIVDDGSTDQTEHIVARHAKAHSFIQLLSFPPGQARSFGSKDRAIAAAYAKTSDLDFDFVGIHDADIAPERTDYYALILREFEREPRLGITGGSIYERSFGAWRRRRSNSDDSVAGAVQMFRRTCFEEIGGYTPLHYGGEDWLAQLKARMLGWRVVAQRHLAVFHYRPSSSASGAIRGCFRQGLMDGSFGAAPLFEFAKCVRRMASTPVLVGGVIRFCGYVFWIASRRKPVIAPREVSFLRSLQGEKLRHFLSRNALR